MTALLPIADTPEMRRQALALAGRHRRAVVAVVLLLHAFAAAAGLIGPPILGSLVQSLQTGIDTAKIDRAVLLLSAFLLLQTVLTFFARRSSFVLSERMFAELREDFMRRVLCRSRSRSSSARASADLGFLADDRRRRLARPYCPVRDPGDVDRMRDRAARGRRRGVGEPDRGASVHRRRPDPRHRHSVVPRSRAGRLPVGAGRVRVPRGDGRRDGRRRSHGRGARARGRARTADRRQPHGRLQLRAVHVAAAHDLVPDGRVAYVLPVVAALAWGSWLVANGHATVGEVTTVVLYIRQLADPVDRLLSWLDEVQVGGASFARLVGIASVEPDREATGEEPEDDWLRADNVRYAYVPGRDVLHGIRLDLEPGERVAVVGPSGAGKSTLGRLLAGIHPPRTGSVEVGGVPLVDLALETLRTEVALVTQEQHVFVGTLADNLRLASAGSSDAALWGALDAVDARAWVEALPDGLETVVGAGGDPLTPPQAQQLALARLVLADPHTLVLDEATSLLDPRAARHLERSLASVLTGRTVVAIAHRLHTAHDADRVAVVEDGLLQELGTHDELIAEKGAYAELWESWRTDGAAS